jgi:hypothetical protein
MSTGNSWGCMIVGSVMVTLFGAASAHAQTPPVDAAPPEPPIATPVSPAAPSPAAPASVAPPSAPTTTLAVQEQPPQPPLIHIEKEPALPPPVMRTDHVHDGFYVRLSLGLGSLGASMNVPHPIVGDIDGSGMSLALDLAVGYAPSPGIVLGGTVMMEKLPSTTVDAARPISTDIGTMLLGPFFDGYPDARGGFHLGAGLGFARAKVERQELAGFTDSNGYGLAGWIGYDMWVADQWSTGLVLRVMGTHTKADAVATENGGAGSASMSTRSIAVMITGLYN